MLRGSLRDVQIGSGDVYGCNQSLDRHKILYGSRPGSSRKFNRSFEPDFACVASAIATGSDQIYTCKKTGDLYAWILKEPQAELLDEQNRVIGHHFAGPTWELNDKSQVVGKVVAKFDDPDSIPWLLLSAVGHSGNGTLSGVTSIQRLHTKDGKAPASGCDAAQENHETRASYTAEYFFYAKP
jgi:hypothetical protein